MADRRLLLVGPLPRARREGVSVGFENLAASLGGDHIVIDTNWLADVKNPGKFDLLRAMESLVVAFRVLGAVSRADAVYLTVSTSRFGFLRDLLVIVSARLFRRRVIGHLKGGGMRRFYLASGRIQRGLIRLAYNRLGAMIVLGRSLKNQFRFMRDRDRIVVVANGLPADIEMHLPDGSVKLGTPLRLLYLSNIVPAKGLSDLVEALPLLQRRLEVRLDVCGAFLGDVGAADRRDGEDFGHEIRRLIARLGLDERVFFHGTVKGDEKIAMLRASHVFVLPTYYVWEGQPISIIEAQAFGLPVVATAFRAIPESVVFGQSAEPCEPRNPASIAAAVSRITATEETFDEYSRAARRNYEQRFRNSVHIENMKRVLYGPG